MSNETVIKMLKQLIADVAEVKSAVAELQKCESTSAECSDKMYRALNIKLDMLQNLDNKSSAAIQQTVTSRVTKQSRPIYFKTIFNEDSAKYLGQLYTQEDIDTVSEDDNVKNAKNDTIRNNRIATAIYNKYVKPNKDRAAAFETIYTAHFN